MTSCDSLTQSQSLKCTQVKFSCTDQESDHLHLQYHFFFIIGSMKGWHKILYINIYVYIYIYIYIYIIIYSTFSFLIKKVLTELIKGTIFNKKAK